MTFKNKLYLAFFISLIPIIALVRPADFSLIGNDNNRFMLQLSAYFGYFGAVFLVWQAVLGSRKIMAKVFGFNHLEILDVHKKLGKYSFPLIALHPVLLAQTYTVDKLYLIDFSTGTEFDQHVNMGRIAYFILLTVWISSALLRNKLKFRPWKNIHLLAYAILPLVFIHALDIGANINSSADWRQNSLKIYWISIFAVYLLAIAYKIATYLGFGTGKYKLIKKDNLHQNIYEFTLEPTAEEFSIKSMNYGQYVYIKPGLLGEAHPFSVSNFDSKTGRIKLTINVGGKFTNKLTKLAQGSSINLDGPYGRFTADDDKDNPSLFISGGIGITPFVQRSLNRKKVNTVLISCTRDLDFAVFRDQLANHLGDNYYDFVNEHEGKKPKNVVIDRLNSKYIGTIATKSKLDLNVAKVYLCGPPPFMEGIKKALLDAGVKEEQIQTEEFSH